MIINCIPTPLLNNNSTYEKLHENHYDVSILKVFCCLCYTNTINPNIITHGLNHEATYIVPL